MLQETTIPEAVKNVNWIPLYKLDKYFAFSVGTLRQFYFYKKYGVEKFIKRIGGRLYVKISDFQAWLDEQGKETA